MTFESPTEFASKITQMLVMWAEVREMEGKKRQVIEHRERRVKLTWFQTLVARVTLVTLVNLG